MRLLIDIGNTRIKWALLEDGRLTTQSAYEYQSGGQLDVQLEQAWAGVERPEAVHLISVTNATVTQEIIRWIEKKWSCPVEQLHTGLHCAGVVNGYTTPQRLGIDRWAAMVAAYVLVKSAVCVIDCGTAMTCDVINSEGRHLGGVITPGRRMIWHSLLNSTAGIMLEESERHMVEWGTDTTSCVHMGWVYSSVGLIERAVLQSQRQLNEPIMAVITGGDAEALLPWLSISYRYESDLVLQGVARMVSESVV